MATEREKMLAGELYFPEDAELVAARKRARRLVRLFNATSEEESSQRKALLQELLGGVGDKIEIEPPFHCDYGSNIRFGNSCFLNFGCVILDCCPVTLGDHVLIGPQVQLLTATHPISAALRASGLESAAPISVGNDVWIGGGVIILPGVKIGARAVIGAGSVVTHDIPEGVVAVGNPCRVIRELP